MGLLTPRQGEVVRTFEELEESEGIQKATEYFYDFSQNTTYIRMNRIAKNLYWKAHTEYGDLEITVNLSKPEKDPKEIAAAKNAPKRLSQMSFMRRKLGYSGRVNHPARQNHRVIPLNLEEKNGIFSILHISITMNTVLFLTDSIPRS